MKIDEADQLRKFFSEQIQIINNMKLDLECDLYVCFEGEAEVPKLKYKQAKLQKMKTQLIQIYASLIGEY